MLRDAPLDASKFFGGIGPRATPLSGKGRGPVCSNSLLTTTKDSKQLLGATRRVAVLWDEDRSTHRAACVLRACVLGPCRPGGRAGAVYYPEVSTILGKKVYRRLVEVPGPIDLVNVFRRPRDLMAHVDDILAKRPRAVWLQLGIRHDTVATCLASAGIYVVQDRCLMVEHKRLMAVPSMSASP